MHLWSVARYDLRLTEKQFYALTPRQFDALVKRRQQEREHSDFMLAQLTSCVVNFSLCRPKEIMTTRDFMPFFTQEDSVKRQRMTKKRRDAIAEKVAAFFSD